MHPMQFLRRIGLILLWLAAPVVAFTAVNKNDPYLLPLRGVGNVALVLASIVIVVVLLRRGHGRHVASKLLVMLWCLPPPLMAAAHLKFELRKHDVLQPARPRRGSSGHTSWWAIRHLPRSRAWPSRD
jgi:beta-N-acetylhexosaminidase